MKLFQSILLIALAFEELVRCSELVTLNTVEVVNKFDGVLTSSVLREWGYSEETTTSLQLANKNIHTIQENAFSGFKYLEYIDLSFNQLSELN